MSDLRFTALDRLTRPEASFRVRLGGAQWRFRVVWIRRHGDDAGAWYLDLATADGTVQARGVRIVEGVDCLGSYRHRTLPPGEILAVDTSGAGAEPGRWAWRDSHRLIYRAFVSDSTDDASGTVGGGVR